jgi:hypothetical protein
MSQTKVHPTLAGNWVLIGTSVASASASLTQTGLDSTYDTYAVVCSDFTPSDSPTGRNLYIRVGDSGGVDSGASDYEYHNNQSTSDAGTYAGINSASAAQIVATAGAIEHAMTFFIGGPADATIRPLIYGEYVCNDGSRTKGGDILGERNAVITLDRVQVLYSSGNIATGRMSVYGIAHV